MKRTYLNSLAALLCIFMVLGSSVIFAQGYNESIARFATDVNDFSITKSIEHDGYVIMGSKQNSEGVYRGVIYELDQGGSPLWMTEINPSSQDPTLNQNTNIRMLHVNSYDFGYVAVGAVQYDVYGNGQGGGSQIVIVTLDTDGNVTGHQQIADLNALFWPYDNVPTHVEYSVLGNDPCFVITGFSRIASNDYKNPSDFNSSDQKSAFVFNVDLSLNPVWLKYYNTPRSSAIDMDAGTFILETEQGYLVTGGANLLRSSGAKTQCVMSMLLDFSGNLIWSNNYSNFDTEASGINEMGASAVLVDPETVAVLSYSNYEQYSLINLIDLNTGNAIASHRVSSTKPNNYIIGHSIGMNSANNLVVSGYVNFEETDLNCTSYSYQSMMPFSIELNPNISSIVNSTIFEMQAIGFEVTGGASLSPVISTNAGPAIYTPEMAYVDMNSSEVAILGYRNEFNIDGSFDVQYISTSTNDFCATREINLDNSGVTFLSEDNTTSYSAQDLYQSTLLSFESTEISFESCSNTPDPVIPPSGNFPLIASASSSADFVYGNAYGGGDLLELTIDNNLYMAGSYHKSMSNPAFSHSDVHIPPGQNPPPGQSIVKLTDIGRPWLAKYDNAGNLLWAKTASGDCNSVVVTCVTSDKLGDVYVTGIFEDGDLMWDGDNNSTPMTSPYSVQDNQSSFIIKYDKNGNFIWRSTIIAQVDPQYTRSNYRFGDIKVKEGKLYGVGSTINSVNFGAGSVLQTQDNEIHAFFAVYDASTGLLINSDSQVGSSGSNQASNQFNNVWLRSLVLDEYNTMYACGNVQYFGSLQNGSSANINVPWVGKYNPNTFNFISAAMPNVGSGSNSSSAADVELYDGSLYLVGEWDGYMEWNSASFSGTGDNDGWIAKMDASTLSMTKLKSINNISSSYDLSPSDVSVNSAGELTIYGNTSGDFTGPQTSTINLKGLQDLFILKYDLTISTLISAWTYSGNTTGSNGNSSNFPVSRATAFNLQESDEECNRIYIAGQYEDGNLIELGIASSPVGGSNVFIARINPDGISFKNQVETSYEDVLTVLDEVIAYPVPAFSKFTLANLPDDQANIDVINFNGKVVKALSHFAGETETIECMDLPVGFYIVRITSSERVNFVKIQIQH